MLNHLTKDFFGNRQSRAIGVAFLAVGLLFGTWATFIPHVKETFDLDDADLGLILLSMPMGAVTMNLIGAWLVGKLGMRTTTIFGMTIMALAFLIPLNATSVYLVPIGLYLCGSCISVTNIAMNTGATVIENNFKVNIMSTCHGMFSVGLMVGSMAASFSRGLEVVPGYHMAAMSLLVILFAILIRPTIFKIQDDPDEVSEGPKAKFIIPSGAFLIMIFIGICGNITEGTMVDWTSVFMRDVVDTSPYFVGWGLAGYSLFMALGRLFGDGLIPKVGPNKIMVYGGLLVIVGVVLAIAYPSTWTAILGFSLVGAGVSCNSPILYGSAARLPGVAKGTGLAVMNTFSMLGFMAGPVLIGFVSNASSLSWALSITIVLASIWTLLSVRVKLF
ncbi:MAG: MFS family permease [Arcticibacterium sp.]|jgi:MFS family permease